MSEIVREFLTQYGLFAFVVVGLIWWIKRMDDRLVCYQRKLFDMAERKTLRLGTILVRLGYCTEAQVMEALDVQRQCDNIDEIDFGKRKRKAN